MSIIRITPGTYSIQSKMYPERVLDLKGELPKAGDPIICYPNGNRENQLWSITYADPSKPSYWFQAVNPPSNMFSSPVCVDAPVTGTPSQKTELQLFESGDDSVYQIVAMSQDGRELLAFEASSVPTDPVVFRAPVAILNEQQWVFVNVSE